MSLDGVAGWVVRRVVVLPVVVVLTVVVVVTWAVASLVAVVQVGGSVVLRRRRPRCRPARILTMAATYLVAECLCLVACFGLWLATGLGWRLGRGRSRAAHRRLLRAFLGLLTALARPAFGFRMDVVEPTRHHDDLIRAESDVPILVFARHAGPGASFALVHLLLSRYDRRVHVVLKDTLRLDPAMDLLLTRAGCTWLPSRRGSSEDSARRVEQAARTLRGNQALLLFPEGADWTPLRHAAAVARLRTRGRFREARLAFRMPHVLPPRPRGALAALAGAPGADVLVFSHTGHENLLDLSSAWAALPLTSPLQMIWWRAPADTVPRDDQDAVGDWLHRVWADMDAWIDEQEQLTARQS